MDYTPEQADRRLSRREASEAVSGLGWRFVLGELRTHVAVRSLGHAVEAAAWATAAAGDHADSHLRADARSHRLILSLQTATSTAVTARDAELAARITTALRGLDLRTIPETGTGSARSVQLIEIAIDAMDIPAVRPFWREVLGYADEPGAGGAADPLVDRLGQQPAVWFQQMDAPRPQRNRVHLDISVPHDEARRRINAALAAGGRLVSDRMAPAFWVLADPEGNEACITTWQGRD